MCLSLIGTFGVCQNIAFEFSESFNFGSSDPLGHFYLVKDEQIRKIDSLGKTLYSYSNPGLGKIFSIDTSDPFRILLYYKPFNQIILLDRTLSSIGDPIELDELDVFSIAGICRAKQGGFWLIDPNNNSLLHLDNNLDIKTKVLISGLNIGNEDQWFPMLEWKEGLYVCEPGQKLMLFDLFGKQIKSIPVKANKIFSLDKNIIFSGDQELHIYQNYPSALVGLLHLNIPKWKQIIISKNHALIERNSGWFLYRIKKTRD